MTDEEIKKALVCCLVDDCMSCPIIRFYDCRTMLKNETISLLNRRQADVVEVKRGHWIEDEVCVYACSECGFTFTSADDISEFKYCRCGAKMDGGVL